MGNIEQIQAKFMKMKCYENNHRLISPDSVKTLSSIQDHVKNEKNKEIQLRRHAISGEL